MRNKWIWILIIFGAVVHLSINVTYGRDYCIGNKCGVWFGDIYRARDELWQISMASVAFNKIPFVMPVYAGAELGGYHYFYGLLMFLVSKLGISLLNINYLLMPIVWFSLYTTTSIAVAKMISEKKGFLFWYLGLQYLAGSAAYIFRIIKHGTILGGDDLNYQSLTCSTNMPLAFGIVLFLTCIWWIKRTNIWNKKNTIILLIILVLAWGLKFYAGFMCLILIDWKRKIRLSFLSIVVSIVTILVIYKPTGTGVFMWKPFAIVHSMIEEKDRFYLPNLVNARYFLYESGKWGPRLLAIETFSTVLYFIFTLGVRVIGMKKWDWELGVPALISFGLAVMLIQKGDWFNPMQFWVFGMLIFNIWTAQVLSELKKPLAILLFMVASLGSVALWYRSNPVYISREEMAALEFLQKQADGVVFSYPFVKGTSNELWKANDTAYVTALSGKQSYYAHTNQLILTGINYQERLDKITENEKLKLEELPVTYFYLVKKHPYYKEVGLPKIFENQEVMILVKK